VICVNIVVDCDDLYDLPSGTVVKIGEARLRLTFYCEPCRKILPLIEFDRILHRRGVFGMFLNDTQIALGDEFAVTEQRFEEIPYAIHDRIRWFLKKHGVRGTALDLVHTLGLPASSGRSMPRLVAKLFASARVVEAGCALARDLGAQGDSGRDRAQAQWRGGSALANPDIHKRLIGISQELFPSA
jgi:hypothetical protein